MKVKQKEIVISVFSLVFIFVWQLTQAYSFQVKNNLGSAVLNLLVESEQALPSKTGVLLVKLKVLQELSAEAQIDRLTCQALNLPWRNSRSEVFGRQMIVKVRLSPQTRVPRASDGVIEWLKTKMQALSAQAPYYCKILAVAPIKNSQQSLSQILRQKIQSQIFSVLGENQISNLLLATSLGFRGTLSINLESQFKSLGLMHLLVVSGYQVSLIFGLILKGLRSLLSRFDCCLDYISIRKITAILSIVITFLFVDLCNFDSAAVRALVTLVLYVVAQFYDLKISFTRLILASAFVCTLIEPLAFLTPSYQLSFAALFGIAFGVQIGQQRGLRTYLLVNLAASTFTGLVTCFWFEQFSFYGLLLNPVLAPLFGFVGCPLVLIALGFSYLSVDWPLQVLGWFFEQSLWVLSWF